MAEVNAKRRHRRRRRRERAARIVKLSRDRLGTYGTKSELNRLRFGRFSLFRGGVFGPDDRRLFVMREAAVGRLESTAFFVRVGVPPDRD